MLLPIYAYGHAVLRAKAKDISPESPTPKELTALIADMRETMYHARGVGLAAPQIGESIRLFIIDTVQLEKEENGTDEAGFANSTAKKIFVGMKQVFINARITEQSGKLWAYEEGCLSIPGIRGDVNRQPNITIEYLDEHFKPHTARFDGINARVIQHEYDHIEGVLFTDKLSAMKQRLIARRLENIRIGRCEADYKMRFGRAK